MKKNVFYALLGAAALVVTLNLTAFKTVDKKDTPDPWKYILVEIYEVPGYNDKGVHIHWGNGKTEIIPFKEMKAEHHDDNGEIILKAMNDLGAKGYHIAHVTSGVAETGMITKVFMTTKE